MRAIGNYEELVQTMNACDGGNGLLTMIEAVNSGAGIAKQMSSVGGAKKV